MPDTVASAGEDSTDGFPERDVPCRTKPETKELPRTQDLIGALWFTVERGDESMEGSQTEPVDDRILWDVIEEHLDEAEFALKLFEAALDDPDYALDSLIEGPEERLVAHVEGLALGGAPVIERELLPAIESASEHPERATIAALALIWQGGRERLGEAVQAAVSASAAPVDVARAVGRACALGPINSNLAESNAVESSAVDSNAGDWLRAQVASASDAEERAAWLCAAAEQETGRQIAMSFWAQWLESDHPATLHAVCRALAGSPDATLERSMVARVESLVGHEDATVRDAALVAGLRMQSPSAWARCREWALDSAQPCPLATELFAALGGATERDALVERLQGAPSSQPLVWALGYCGSIEAIPALLSLLESDDEYIAPLAFEAIITITGVDSTGLGRDQVVDASEAQAALPSLEDDLDTDLSLRPEDALPKPNADAVRAWWEAHRERFSTDVFYLFGTPESPEAFARALEQGPLRNRHAIARAAALRTGGTFQLPTRAWGCVQQNAIAPLRAIGNRTWRARRS